MAEMDKPGRGAILLIDFQADFLQADGKLPVAQAQVAGILQVANHLVEMADEQDLEVVYIGNEYSKWNVPINWLQHNAAIRGSAGAKLDQRLNVINSHYFAKARRDAFSNPNLHPFLQEREVKQLYLAGVFANACIKGTAYGAVKRNYEVNVISDGVAAASEKIRSTALRNIGNQGIRIVTSEEVVAQRQKDAV